MARITYVITTGESGGAQSHLYDLCTNLPRRFVPAVITGFKGPMGERLARAGIPVHVIPALQRDISPLTDVKALRQMGAIIRLLRPDLVCTHSSKAGILGRMAARQMGIPAVFTAHGWSFTEGVPPLAGAFYRIAERWAGRRCHHIICVSEYDYRLALRYGIAARDQLAVVHNGIPVCTDEPVNTGEAGRPVRIIMVARFAPQKNQLLLLQAADRVGAAHPLELLLVGDGPLLAPAQECASRLSISASVSFLGDRDDVVRLLNDSDIFVLSSWWEGLPITVLEAMLAGLPVIASDVGGCREAVADGITGLLFAPGDLAGLCGALERLVSDRDLRRRMGEEGRKRMKRHFTVERMVAGTVQVYDQVLAQGPAK